MIIVAAVVGYLIGSLPTANGLARLWGVDLRTTGTGNPGANNARRAGGITLAALVLIVEIGKGVAAVAVGAALAGDPGAVASGVAAAAGNVYNVWYGFDGGKGLGISSGVVIGAWPPAFPILLGVMVIAVLITRSSGYASLATVGAILILSFVWPAAELPVAWGITDLWLLPFLAGGLVALLAPKHLADARRPFREPSRP